MLLFSLDTRRALYIMSRPNLLHLELNVEPSSLTGPRASLSFSIKSRMCTTAIISEVRLWQLTFKRKEGPRQK
jgi:hypothetical protein